jgi:AraC family transcriptional regulator of adaptative response / methylphosphotriester-DNA alkyltransferase methyltransferase
MLRGPDRSAPLSERCAAKFTHGAASAIHATRLRLFWLAGERPNTVDSPYLRHMPRRASTDAWLAQLAREAVEVLDTDYAADLSLPEVARRLRTSPRQLERALAIDGGSPFRTRLTAIRLDRATALLADPLATVAEVAHSVGYRQPAHFAKAFRQAHGLSPSAWRQQLHGHGRASRSERELRRWREEMLRSEAALDEELRRWWDERGGAKRRRTPS